MLSRSSGQKKRLENAVRILGAHRVAHDIMKCATETNVVGEFLHQKPDTSSIVIALYIVIDYCRHIAFNNFLFVLYACR
jgi:hypothetical protein